MTTEKDATRREPAEALSYLRTSYKMAMVSHFVNLFKFHVNLDFDIEDLENDLAGITHNACLPEIMGKLLSTLSNDRNTNATNWITTLRRQYARRSENPYDNPFIKVVHLPIEYDIPPNSSFAGSDADDSKPVTEENLLKTALLNTLAKREGDGDSVKEETTPQAEGAPGIPHSESPEVSRNEDATESATETVADSAAIVADSAPDTAADSGADTPAENPTDLVAPPPTLDWFRAEYPILDRLSPFHLPRKNYKKNMLYDFAKLPYIETPEGHYTDAAPVEWDEVSLETQVDALHNVCEWHMVEPERFRRQLKFEDDTGWRLDPVGSDSEGVKYYALSDNRLWMQRPPPPIPTKRITYRTVKWKRTPRKPAAKAARPTPKPLTVTLGKRPRPPAAAPASQGLKLKLSMPSAGGRSLRSREVTTARRTSGRTSKRTRASFAVTDMFPDLGDSDEEPSMSVKLTVPRGRNDETDESEDYEGDGGEDDGEGEGDEDGSSSDLSDLTDLEELEQELVSEGGEPQQEEDQEDDEEEEEEEEEAPPPPAEEELLLDADGNVEVDTAIATYAQDSRYIYRATPVRFDVEAVKGYEHIEPWLRWETVYWTQRDAMDASGFVEWEAVCLNLADWEQFIERLSGSKAKPERALHALLQKQYLPVVTEEYKFIEQRRKEKMAELNRKRSTRLALKELQQEHLQAEYEELANGYPRRNRSARIQQQATANPYTTTPVESREDRLKRREARALAEAQEAALEAEREAARAERAAARAAAAEAAAANPQAPAKHRGRPRKYRTSNEGLPVDARAADADPTDHASSYGPGYATASESGADPATPGSAPQAPRPLSSARERELDKIERRRKRQREAYQLKKKRRLLQAQGVLPDDDTLKKQFGDATPDAPWYVDCERCGVSGWNVDDGSEIIACDHCDEWQHVHCLQARDEADGRAPVDYATIDFTCTRCRADPSRERRVPPPGLVPVPRKTTFASLASVIEQAAADVNLDVKQRLKKTKKQQLLEEQQAALASQPGFLHARPFAPPVAASPYDIMGGNAPSPYAPPQAQLQLQQQQAYSTGYGGYAQPGTISPYAVAGSGPGPGPGLSSTPYAIAAAPGPYTIAPSSSPYSTPTGAAYGPTVAPSTLQGGSNTLAPLPPHLESLLPGPSDPPIDYETLLARVRMYPALIQYLPAQYQSHFASLRDLS